MTIRRDVPDKETASVTLGRLKAIRDKLINCSAPITYNDNKVFLGEFNMNFPNNTQDAIKHINLRIREYELYLRPKHSSDKDV